MQSIPIHYERPALFDLGDALPFRFVYTGIRVRDMDESIRFYTEVLGMTLVERMTTAPTKGKSRPPPGRGPRKNPEPISTEKASHSGPRNQTAKILNIPPSKLKHLLRP